MQPDVSYAFQGSGSPFGSIAFVIFAMVLLALAIRLIAGGQDRKRVERYVSSFGGQVLDHKWTPLGPGWFGEKDARIYQIVYRDRQQRIHRAHVKTSLFSGVYLTEDVIISEGGGVVPTAGSVAAAGASREGLLSENAQLKARIRKLEQMQAAADSANDRNSGDIRRTE